MKIRKDKLTGAQKKLYNILIDIWDDVDFIAGVLNSLESDEECEDVIEYIENNKAVSPSQITLLAIDIDHSRGGIIKDAFFADLEKAAKELKHGKR